MASSHVAVGEFPKDTSELCALAEQQRGFGQQWGRSELGIAIPDEDAISAYSATSSKTVGI